MNIQKRSLDRYIPNLKFATWFSNCKTSTIWWAVFIGAAIFYGITAQTNVSWQDNGRFQWRILTSDYFWPEGVAANAHPLLIAIGQIVKLIPFGNILWRLNWISGLGMAIALANFMAVVMVLINRRWLALSVTAMFALSHAIWFIATMTQTYTWNLAGMTLELWLIIKLIREPSWSYLSLLAFVNGITLSIHGLAMLMFPVDCALALYLVYKKKLPLWAIGIATLAYFAGASLFIVMVVKLAARSGSIGFALFDAFVGVGYDMLTNTKLLTTYTIPNTAIALLSFVNVLLPLAIIGWFKFRSLIGSTTAFVFGAITLIDVVFVIRLKTPEIFPFMLPMMTMIALTAAVGANYLVQLSGRWRHAVIISSIVSIVGMPIVYGVLPDVLHGFGIEVKRSRMLPFRDEMRYWIIPWKCNENSAQLFAEAALRQAAPNGVILTDMTPFSVLLVVRSMNTNYENVGITSGKWRYSALPPYDSNPEKFRQCLGDRPLYVVSPIQPYVDEGILHDAEVQKCPDEVIYRVSWKKTQNKKEN